VASLHIQGINAQQKTRPVTDAAKRVISRKCAKQLELPLDKQRQNQKMTFRVQYMLMPLTQTTRKIIG